MLDDERCILCTRCIRFTKDIAGDDALGIVNRGSYNTLTAYPGKAFDNNYTLNTVDICPVGALTSKDFRFQMRVWFLKETKSLCTSCATGCNIIIGSREEKIYRYTPRENDAVNGPWMCDAGRLNYKWIGREDRLKKVQSPKSKAQGQPAAWSAASTEIADKLKSAPAGTVAIVASARQTNEELWLISKLKAQARRPQRFHSRAGEGDKLLVSADKNPNTNGAQLTGMAANPMGTNLPKIAKGIRSGKIKTLIVFGEDVTNHGLGRGFAGQTGNAHRERHFAERDDPAGALFVARLRPRREARHVHEHEGPRPEIHEGGRTARRGAARMGIFARPGLQRHRPGRFPDHRRSVQRNGKGRAGVQRSDVGGTRRNRCDGENLNLWVAADVSRL